MTHPANGPKVVVYSRDGCHLCDEVCQLLHTLGVAPDVVDIDEDPQLRQQFDTCVPVVEIAGKIRFRGKVNAVLLQRQLEADRRTTPASPTKGLPE